MSRLDQHEASKNVSANISVHVSSAHAQPAESSSAHAPSSSPSRNPAKRMKQTHNISESESDSNVEPSVDESDSYLESDFEGFDLSLVFDVSHALDVLRNRVVLDDPESTLMPPPMSVPSHLFANLPDSGSLGLASELEVFYLLLML